MNLIYTGPLGDGVELVDPATQRVYEFVPGEPVEVPDELADSLLRQEGNFAATDRSPKTDDINPSSDPSDSEPGSQPDADPAGDENEPQEPDQ